jgi:hypothetical protein
MAGESWLTHVIICSLIGLARTCKKCDGNPNLDGIWVFSSEQYGVCLLPSLHAFFACATCSLVMHVMSA